jgi:N-acetylglucosaminyldiphosphoundecaprenol N-acetyl-beta-D-mannosaminyltransferase
MSFTHFLYGSTPETLEKLKANLEEKFPGIQIVGTYAPPFRPLHDAEEEELQQIVSACKPDFFWVGLSTPKQERFMAAHAPMAQGEPVDSEPGLSVPICPSKLSVAPLTGSMIVDKVSLTTNNEQPATDSGGKRYPLDAGILLGVGAAFDFHADNLKDAPAWMKNSGLQWFYRLCQEPRRLWRRYFDIVPTFLWLTIMQLLGIRKYTIEDGGAGR